MGKKRLVTIAEESAKPAKEEKKETKKSLKEKRGVRVPGLKGGERVVAVMGEIIPEEKPTLAPRPRPSPKPPRKRGKKYLAAKAKIDQAKFYSFPEAIKLLKETSPARFDGTAEIHLLTTKTGLRGETALPYFQGKTRQVEIASQQTLKKIEARKIDFDVLIATPAFMSQLVKYAKILGPRGLMPNPKNGTITDKPEEMAKTLQKRSISFKTEQNAPLIHAVFGKVSQKEEELEANLKTLLQTIGPQNIKKAVISSTMGPGIKIAIDNSQSRM